jgi:hypothetical protein
LVIVPEGVKQVGDCWALAWGQDSIGEDFLLVTHAELDSKVAIVEVVAVVGKVGQVGEVRPIGEVGHSARVGEVGEVGQVGEVVLAREVDPFGEVAPVAKAGPVGEAELKLVVGRVGVTGEEQKKESLNQTCQQATSLFMPW